MNLTNIQGISALTGLGLKEEDIMVYTTLIAQPDYVSIRKISELTGINRGRAYESMKLLVNKNLVSYNRKGDKKQYFAEKPERIAELIAIKKMEFEQLEKHAKSLIPRLSATVKRQEGRPQVRFYENDEGMVAILNDVLATVSKLKDKTYDVYSHKDIRPIVYRQYNSGRKATFYKNRIKAGIASVNVIKIGPGELLFDSDKVEWLDDHEAKDAKSYQIIYGDKVAMISVSDDNTPYGVVIEEKGVATMHRIIFRKQWAELHKNAANQLANKS